MPTFGQIIASARKGAGISQKDFAAQIRKEDGDTISPQYLNDIEHNRRNPPSEFIIDQFAKVLGLSREHLIGAACMLPNDLKERLPGAQPERVEAAFQAFRKALKGK